MPTQEAQTRTRQGNALCCSVCKHDRFYEREYAFRSTLASFFNHYWNADNVVAYVCEKCGNMLTFAAAKPAPKAEPAPSLTGKVTSRVL